MKNLIRNALTVARRAIAYWQMRSIEINLHDAINLLTYVRDPDTRESMVLSIRFLSKALCQARAKYIGLLPPGQRLVFKFA